MSDPVTRLNAALEGLGKNRRVLLLIIGSLLLPMGCGVLTGPSFSTLIVTTASLPNAGETVAYNETLAAIGGDGSYTWSLTVGSLPADLSLNTSTGEISGTPTVIKTDDFTVEVTSGNGQTATQALTITVGPYCSVQPASAIVTFEDANLEASVRAGLGIGAQDDLTCGLVSGLSGLDRSISSRFHSPIESLMGIQNLTSLTFLDLHDGSITDVSPLSGLTNLKDLFLYNNSISDISALSGLTSLTELALGRNSITDIGALSGLTNLDTLFLQDNSITDISPLSGLTGLTKLALSGNSFTDISPISGLTSLTILGLHRNSITDVSLLSGLTSLETLVLQDNSITDISPLSALTSLTVLYLHDNAITDISALSGLTNLSFLWLDNNPDLSNIQPLLNNPGLGAGDRVRLESTNVSCTDVAALRGQGVSVDSLGCP